MKQKVLKKQRYGLIGYNQDVSMLDYFDFFFAVFGFLFDVFFTFFLGYETLFLSIASSTFSSFELFS